MGNKDKIIRVDENLLELAEQRQISASATVGFLQYQGDVFFKKNEKKAFEFLLYASEKNHPMAMDWLGVLYLDGLGTDKDINKARKWLELAAYYGREHAKNLIKKI
jgi:TPR repeat protein